MSTSNAGARPTAADRGSRRAGTTTAELRGALLAVLVVTVLGLVDVSAGPDVVVAGLLTVGPCIAAIAGTPRSVVAVGVYAVAAILLLSWPDRLWWTLQQAIYLVALVAVTALSAVAARRRAREEEELRASEADAARAHAESLATVEFLSRVSHGLRTPLNAILGFTQLLQRDDLTPDQRETTEQISRGGRHLLALVDDVLDVTAVDAGRMTLTLEPVSVAVAVREALELAASPAQAEAVQVQALLGDAEGSWVLADPRRLRQVVVTLLANAVRQVQPSGAVTLSARRADAGTVAIAVSDTGRGLSAEELRTVFAPFGHADAVHAGAGDTGLGLAVAHGLAAAMGGSLTVAGHEGLGTTFTLTLTECPAPDAGPPAVPAMTREAPAAPEPARPARVLYVEDNVSNLRLVERVLELRPGWRLTHAADGGTGLDLALASAFDLVLLDKNLPDLNGLEVLRQLRSRENRVRVPVVILSADAAPGAVTRAIRAGASDYLVKPFSVDGLLAVLDEHTPRPDARPGRR